MWFPRSTFSCSYGSQDPSRCCILCVQPSGFKFSRTNPLAVKFTNPPPNTHFDISQQPKPKPHDARHKPLLSPFCCIHFHVAAVRRTSGQRLGTCQRSDAPSVSTASVPHLLFVLSLWSSALCYIFISVFFVTQRSRMGVILEQERLQCTYNVTLGRVRVTIVAVENQ